MLRKLIKHEFKATARLLLPIYIVLAAIALLCKLIHSLDIYKGVLYLIPGVFTVIYAISVIASLAVTFIFAVIRFYKNLISDEGYLMFTLPVKPTALINSKLIVSISWLIINAAVIFIASAFTFPNIISEIIEGFLDSVAAEFGSRSYLIATELIIMIMINIVYTMLLFYVSIAIGQLYRSKIIFSVVAYLCIYFATQIIAVIIVLCLGLMQNDLIFSTTSIPKLILPFFIVFYLALTVVLYIITNFIFSNKLNLD